MEASYALSTNGSAQHNTRPYFFSATRIRSLQHSLRRPLRVRVKPQARSNYETSESSQSSNNHSRGSSCPSHYDDVPRSHSAAPDMGDYLSLDQLEGLWQYQDSYVGPVVEPLTFNSPCNFQEVVEAVEAPTFVQHKCLDNVSVPLGNKMLNLGVTRSDEALIVDGYLHPAIRSTPNLQLPVAVEMDRRLPTAPVFVDELPPPRRVPVNRSRVATDFPRLSAIGKPVVPKSGKPVLSKLEKPVPMPAERPSTSWTSRRQFLREDPGLI